ncbi:hypothetical protein [Alkalicoccobacillus porphyridii]|uniref:Uncharacterized protein n=1 Tax=Alkalicoccobacillus porphyridii TaxID=2597270 RepID=A0A554A2I0_9BACI|nr:hypothetical protein [Alkalicoccobacillus porphyridii]TSB47904.1 hypothetical protein FN960_05200 [Alkalicoccobacillus porphyridii]
MRQFRILDYIIIFVLSFVFFIIQIIGAPTLGTVLGVILFAAGVSLVLGTITNLIRLLFRKVES